MAHMERCGVFNAGKGACLTADRRIQLDAAVMTGERSKGAGVGLVDCTFRAVELARWVAENTPHVLLAGAECRNIAKAAGFRTTTLTPTAKQRQRYEELLEAGKDPRVRNVDLWRRLQGGNTVGAVALDQDCVPAAAASTGGIWFKLPGRIGDSAILGAGVYADLHSGAACATGTGEEIIRNALTWNACAYMHSYDATEAASRAIGLVGRRSGRGTAGIVTVDLKGRVGWAYNTEAMGRAWWDSDKGRIVVQV